MTFQIEPIYKQVILQAIEEEDNHGFIVPEQLKKKRLAEVIAVGPKVEQVSAGDTVAFRPQLVQELELDGQKYLVSEEHTLLCIIREKADE